MNIIKEIQTGTLVMLNIIHSGYNFCYCDFLNGLFVCLVIFTLSNPVFFSPDVTHVLLCRN